MNYVNFKNEILNNIVHKEILLASELQEFKISDDLTVKAEKLAEGELVVGLDDNAIVSQELPYEGKLYKTDETGVIISVEDVVAEEEAVEEVEAAEETPASEEATVENDSAKELEDANKRIADLEAENADLKAQLADLKQENVELSAEPAFEDREVKNQVPYEELTKWGQFKYRMRN